MNFASPSSKEMNRNRDLLKVTQLIQGETCIKFSCAKDLLRTFSLGN